MGQTLTEKILSARAGQRVRQGEFVVVDVDLAMATDTTAPLAIRAFREMGGTRLFDPRRVVLVIDHASPAPTEKIANLHQLMRAFARETGATLYDVGSGIVHHVLIERGHIEPSSIVVGADSHSCTYGALGAFATGMGSTDVAGIFRTGKTWMRVPESQCVRLEGRLRPGVSAKDAVLTLVKDVTISGANYQALEYVGGALDEMPLYQRIPFANMAIEMGAKVGLFPPMVSRGAEHAGSRPDPDATYVRTHVVDLGDVEPMIAVPHRPDDVHPVSKVAGRRIDVAFLGACTNTRLGDLREAAALLLGRTVAPHVRLMVSPASRQVMQEAAADGTLHTLLAAGATLLPSGCGPCVGTHLGVPGDGEVVISAANRNFQGRMGNRNAEVYLASPATVAASALAGEIAVPPGAGRRGRA